MERYQRLRRSYLGTDIIPPYMAATEWRDRQLMKQMKGMLHRQHRYIPI